MDQTKTINTKLKGNLRLTGGKTLQSPKSFLTRPTTSIVREALINILGKSLINCNWLDLFSGSGIIGCEALQRGAKRVLAIEKHNETAEICKKNLLSTSFQINNPAFLEVISSEVIKSLIKGCKSQSMNYIKEFPNEDYRFDFIYLDPPYKSDLYRLTLENILHGDWIKKEGLAICECSTKFFPSIPKKWVTVKTKQYGNNLLVFLTPNQA